MADRPAATPLDGLALKISDMIGVREYAEGHTVELWRDFDSGRLVIRAYNQLKDDCVDVDLWDVIDWLSTGPRRGGMLDNGARATFTVGNAPERDPESTRS